MEITEVAVANLVPYAKNARTHSAAQVAQIAASITQFGFTNPLLVDESLQVIAGHGRLAAAGSLGRQTVPCIVLKGLSEAQRRALVIADNRLAENAGWDVDLLRLELADLKLADFDLGLMGFSAGELERLLGPTGGLTDPDAAPSVPAEPVSAVGDVWLCGGHRVACGDSAAEVDVMRLLAGVKPHLMVTDPPYGVEYDPEWRVKDNPAQYKGGKTTSIGVVQNDAQVDWRLAFELFPGDVAYVWHADRHASTTQMALEAAHLQIRCQIVWAKQGFVFGRGDYHWQHEPCWYAVRKGRIGHWSGDRKQTTLWQITNLNTMKGGKPDDATTGHSTQKPIECMRRPVENNSSPGQAVYDPFLGSGTTLIACEQTERVCYGQELMPVYVDVAVQRWQNFTGKKALRESDGVEFDKCVAENQLQPS